jgi:hypothetical protein
MEPTRYAETRLVLLAPVTIIIWEMFMTFPWYFKTALANFLRSAGKHSETIRR